MAPILMIEAYALMSSDNVLSLAVVHAKREDAEKSLRAEYPPGCRIFPSHRVVRIGITILEEQT